MGRAPDQLSNLLRLCSRQPLKLVARLSRLGEPEGSRVVTSVTARRTSVNAIMASMMEAMGVSSLKSRDEAERHAED